VPARKSANCYIANFAANSEKIPLDLAENQLKWQHCVAVAIGNLWICNIAALWGHTLTTAL